MADVSGYLAIRWILLQIFCYVWIVSSDGGTISKTVGSKGILHCNKLNGTLNQLTWKINGSVLFSYKPQKDPYINKEAERLKINISVSEDEQLSLIIERVQKYHSGNYTCEVASSDGTLHWNWELLITEHEVHDEAEKWRMMILVAVFVPCVCFLVSIISWAILRGCSRHREDRNQHATTGVMQSEDIYENCLEMNVHVQEVKLHPHHNPKQRAH
ncbi:cell surface glycoprotein CD200 receptor 1-B-like [Echeneis naucrates]|uniref:cell surface glycoprotein CD200 receptor 1-B-like n=1 Tax=Echeneis naucrates TaxID=173247 RepID=UPI0011142527|nr:cell surface glycoprotein CD200 receptor 1-B-like [Echeneis naucrates]